MHGKRGIVVEVELWLFLLVLRNTQAGLAPTIHLHRHDVEKDVRFQRSILKKARPDPATIST